MKITSLLLNIVPLANGRRLESALEVISLELMF